MLTINLTYKRSRFKDLMRSKNTSGYFSFYVDNIAIKHIPLEILKKIPHNTN